MVKPTPDRGTVRSMTGEMKLGFFAVSCMFLYLANAVSANTQADNERALVVAELKGNLQVMEVIQIGALNEARISNGKPPMTLGAARADALRKVDELRETE